ncbi:MAG TPA: TolC family protein [Candidatus Hydrogenedentes bacterium]|jgi:outer membrane protein TolC|nr:TolC family protein [Candidatus Hydrogenedentota bacterium]HPJ99575.1 TolC family protein [Candidatus Hydrogenedentota bacterium]
MNSRKRVAFLCAVLALLLVVSCSTSRYKEKADAEVYPIISEKSLEVPGSPQDFTIDQEETLSLEGLPTLESEDETLGDSAPHEAGFYILSLEKALSVAVKRSRDYQSQKESLYESALALTLQRHRFDPIFAGRFRGDYNRTTRDVLRPTDAALVARELPRILERTGELTGGTGALLNSYADVVRAAAATTGVAGETRAHIVDERSVTGSSNLGFDLLLAGGARIAVDLTSNFLRFVTGDPRVATSSTLQATVTQPLLSGAGRDVVLENLTQAERNVLYQLRSFTRYRKNFAIDIANAYYRVLQNRDAVRNNWSGYLAFQDNAKRQRALAQAGRIKVAELGRNEQAELQARDRYIASVQNYADSLDQFKIKLGLSTDAPILLDQGELELLREKGLDHPNLAPEQAIEIALVSRLDLMVARDRVEDTERKLLVAANALQPNATLVAQGRASSYGQDRFQSIDFDRAEASIGLSVDPLFDRKAERNAYRSALIDYARSVRSLEEATDLIKLDVRQAWRNLQQAQVSYQIQEIGVQLNERRVREQELLLQAGRGSAIDQVDAQNSLIASQNELTAALVQHTIARLSFWRDMGILFIKEDGQWEDITDDNYSGEAATESVEEEPSPVS